MSKRGSKLQEFVAHASSNVNCLSIGKKLRRVFVTGGDDRKVNLWAVGRTTPLLCLSGHTSPVKSVTYDSEEVLVVAGASSGTIKLWDLEQSKIVRTLTGHRAKCSSVEFHPFGEFFASGSSGTDLKIWDIRKKACIHTYNGHSRGITTIRFTPDGRWVVSCGEDNVVKVWDLTAGRLLHDFKSHGVVQCIDFHPHEFLMATGSADRVVQFWDLETFELIGSSGSEASGVRSVTFHPDGRTLFCGLDESLKVFSWEPIRCHDAVDMGWSHLGDLCIHEGQLFGCSYHQSRVAIWIADISLIGPYASGIIPRSNNNMDPESNNGENPPVAHLGTGMICNISAATLHKNKTEEITKNPHLTSSKSTQSVPLRDDSVHRVSPANSVGSQMSKSIEDGHCNGQGVELSLSAKLQRSGSLTSKDHLVNGHIRRNRQAINRPVAGPVVPPRDSLESRNTLSYKNEAASAKTVAPATPPKPTYMRKLSLTNGGTGVQTVGTKSESLNSTTNASAKTVAPVTPPKPTYMRKLSLTNGGTGVQTVGTKSESLNSTTNALDAGLRPNFLSRSMVNTETIESAEGHHASIKNAAEKIERIQLTDPPLSFRHENCKVFLLSVTSTSYMIQLHYIV
ncbi:hypothetical protein QJS10_CPB21g00709 [Acorus calamus]|uniref:Katanin p80 WD40 repeat-containing subunit B1 homolog n=1 Tax=Acorus calamus TaxID=4465 RepID=A0AAV9C5H0_ACOCL|nr:hypothetical protein QJS10_CPB21g00709 [Acorus calamus]